MSNTWETSAEAERDAARERLPLHELVGVRHLIAVTSAILGIDGVFYKYGAGWLSELFEDEIILYEMTRVVHHVDMIVTFHLQPCIPFELEHSSVFAVNEKTGRVIIGCGYVHMPYTFRHYDYGRSRPAGMISDGTIITRLEDRFSYNLKGWAAPTNKTEIAWNEP